MHHGNGQSQRTASNSLPPFFCVFVVDAVGDDFGIGLRFEGGTQTLTGVRVRLPKFSMMPLWTTTIMPPEIWGWALGSVYTAVGCQRVWPMPIWPNRLFSRAASSINCAADTTDAFDFAVHVYGNTRRIISLGIQGV